MNRTRKALFIAAAAVMFHSQLPICGAAETGSRNPAEGITENEPRIISSEEIPFGRQQPAVRRGVWIGVGAAVAAVLVAALAAGGGSDDGGGNGGPVDPVAGSGDVSFDW